MHRRFISCRFSGPSGDRIAAADQDLHRGRRGLDAAVLDGHHVEVIFLQGGAVVQRAGGGSVDQAGVEEAVQTAVPTRSITSVPTSPFRV